MIAVIGLMFLFNSHGMNSHGMLTGIFANIFAHVYIKYSLFPLIYPTHIIKPNNTIIEVYYTEYRLPYISFNYIIGKPRNPVIPIVFEDKIGLRQFLAMLKK